MNYWAHVRNKEDGEIEIQSVKDHLLGTAEKAQQCLENIGLGNTGYLAGILHDMGKYTDRFQTYIQTGDVSRKGSVIHTFQGCDYILRRFHEPGDFEKCITSELIAYAIAAHHGLFDCIDPKEKNGFRNRLERKDIGYEEAVRTYFKKVINEEKIENLFSKSVGETYKIINRLSNEYKYKECYFEMSLLVRLLLSAVIEGDRSDTASFMENVGNLNWPEDMSSLWSERLKFMESKLMEFPQNRSIDFARSNISDQCKAFATNGSDVYRLNVPTGGGKTLSSLRYALAHAKYHNKKRIIFTSPLLSILEQNAKVIHDFVGDDSIILEHHSNLVQNAEKEEELDMRELMMQSWDAPIIITTMVQLLNTLFDGKTSSVRRFHSLCDSIIVIDEVQTVPPRMITLFNLAIQFLKEQCNATIVLCSATQPPFECVEHGLKSEPASIVPYDEKIWTVFERTKIQNLEGRRLEELPELIHSIMSEANSLLVVCNKKDEAAYLLNEIKDSEYVCFHLSASMCMQHRRNVVEELKNAIKNDQKTVCVSTQVIEAGVDISFEQVIRLTAGMDSVVQAAGRCNRNGESENICPVYVVNCTDENLGMLQDIQRGKTAAIELMEMYRLNPEKFDYNLASDKAIKYYYSSYYRDMNGGARDFPLKLEKATTLFELLGFNEDFEEDYDDNFLLRQAFKTAGSNFKVFDNDTTDIVVPYGEGNEIIKELCSQQAEYDISYRKKLISKARNYTVSLYDYQKKKLGENNAIDLICKDSVYVLQPEFYDEKTGIKMQADNLLFWEV